MHVEETGKNLLAGLRHQLGLDVEGQHVEAKNQANIYTYVHVHQDVERVGVSTGTFEFKIYVNHYVKHPGLDVGLYT